MQLNKLLIKQNLLCCKKNIITLELYQFMNILIDISIIKLQFSSFLKITPWILITG